MIQYKRCTKCKVSKTVDNFHRQKNGKYGVSSRCKICRSSYHRERLNEVRSRRRSYNREWRKNNSGRIANYIRLRRASMPTVAKANSISNRLRKSLTGKVYSVRSEIHKIVGIDSVSLVNYLWDSFEENYGLPREYIDVTEVSIDHIKPLSLASTVAEVVQFNHYTNLQLLFLEDNMAKGNKFKG